MIINGLICLALKEKEDRISWSTRLNGVTLLELAIKNLQGFPYISNIFILTDCQKIADGIIIPGVKVCVLPDYFFRFGLPFLAREQWILTRAINALEQVGANGQVLLIADWRNPQIISQVFETLYHKLMEDRVAARTVCAYPLDPNLFMRLDDGSFFPVWADVGVNRQAIPQLYRTTRVGAIRTDRLLMDLPETLCVHISRIAALEIKDDETLSLAEFYLEYMKDAKSYI